MSKPYANRELKNGDAVEIERIVRECAPFVVTPSNIEDEYDIELLRKASLTTGVELKVLLDNNIFTQIIPLMNRGQSGKQLNSDQLKACAVMCFLIYAGIEVNPIPALWERPNHYSWSKKDEDLFFRVADHLHPQVFADLALQRICSIDGEIIKEASMAVFNNPKTMMDVHGTSFSNEPNELFNLFLGGVLKVWCINRTGGERNCKLEMLLDWMYNDSILCLEVVALALDLFVDGRSGGIFKKINSSEYRTVVANARNAAWDLLYMNILQRVHAMSGGDTIWFLVTRDNNLLKVSDRIFQLCHYNAKLQTFFDSSYPSFGYEEFMRSMSRFNTRPEREQHISEIMNTLDSGIEQLEKQVQHILA